MNLTFFLLGLITKFLPFLIGLSSQVCEEPDNMWTMCLGATSGNQIAKSITVNELSRDVYICGSINVDSTSKYQEFMVA